MATTGVLGPDARRAGRVESPGVQAMCRSAETPALVSDA
jgi:hypothetical protein